MATVISLLIFLVVLAIVGACGWWIIKKFELPQPVLWVFGLLLLLALLLFVFGGFGNVAVVRL
jgi:hypothetical protein